jgi:hypothetical protein
VVSFKYLLLSALDSSNEAFAFQSWLSLERGQVTNGTLPRFSAIQSCAFMWRSSLDDAFRFFSRFDKRLSFSLTNPVPCQDSLDHCPLIQDVLVQVPFPSTKVIISILARMSVMDCEG